MESSEGISCIAVGDMLKRRLEEYTDALSNGVDKATLARMESDIDKIEAVHDKCIEMGDVTDVDTPGDGVDEAEGGDNVDDSVDSTDDWSKRMYEEEEEN